MVRTTKSKRKKILTKLEMYISQLKPKDMIDLLLYGTAAYYGFRAVPSNFPVDARLGGSAFTMMALRLATSDNTAAGLSGVVGLSGVGLANVIDSNTLKAAIDPVAALEDAVKVLWNIFHPDMPYPIP